jgi:hypothetical protein
MASGQAVGEESGLSLLDAVEEELVILKAHHTWEGVCVCVCEVENTQAQEPSVPQLCVRTEAGLTVASNRDDLLFKIFSPVLIKSLDKKEEDQARQSS